MHRITMTYIPNILSSLRIVLTVPIVWALSQQAFGTAGSLFVLAGISDAFDGYIAKRFHCQSRIGAILDPIADKLLLVSTYIALAWVGAIPLWLCLLVLVRDIIIVAGAVGYHYVVADLHLRPTQLSKCNTVLQIVFVVLVFVQTLAAVPNWLFETAVFAVACSTVLSGCDYVWRWSKQAVKKTSTR